MLRLPDGPTARRPRGLAVPTALAAVVCGGSVFAIAAAGALALEPDPDALRVSSAALAGAAAPTVWSAPPSTPALPPADATPAASTGPEYTVVVEGGAFDDAGGPLSVEVVRRHS